MLAKAGSYNHPETDELLTFFEFRASFDSNVVRVEWPAHEVVTLFPANVVSGLVKKGYARIPTPVEVDRYVNVVTMEQLLDPKGADKKATDEKAAADKKAADEKAAEEKAAADKKAADEKVAKEAADAAKKPSSKK